MTAQPREEYGDAGGRDAVASLDVLQVRCHQCLGRRRDGVGGSEHAWSMSASDPQADSIRDSVRQALTEIMNRGSKNGRGVYSSARRWEHLHFALGGLAVVLAAAAAGTGLASAAGQVPAAILAIASGAVTGLATFFDSEKRGRAQHAVAAAWFRLGEDARSMLEFKLHDDRWLTSSAEQAIRDLRDRQARLLRGEIGNDGEPGAEASGSSLP